MIELGEVNLKMCKKIMYAVGTVLLPLAVFASNEPLDLTATGVTLAGYIATAAGAALAIFLGLFGIRVIVRAFKSVK